MSDEQLLDAVSTLNENDQPHLGTCTLVVGDGTTKIAFNNGRAKVPASLAKLVAQHPHVHVIDPPDDDDDEDEVEAPAKSKSKSKKSKKADPEPEPELEEEPSEDVKAAIEHLQAEEEADDEPEPDRSGFEATTVDGQPRCQAAKGDGSQCANPATDGAGCGLPAHQAQVNAT